MKAIIYCRKSTDREDKQVQSLDDQLAWCRETAKTLGYEVIEEITEAISAKTPDKRPGFKRMLGMLKKWEADRIITWKANRLARNPIDQSYIEWYLQEWIMQEIVSTDWYFRNGDNVLILRMYFWMSTQYVLDLKKDTIRGMRSKVEKGGIVSKPPPWYSIVWGEAVQNDFVKGIKTIFDLRNQGWSLADISKEIFEKYNIKTKHGKPLSHGYIETIVSNPFYYGAIKWTGEIFSGRHTPLVTQDEWNRANSIKRGVAYKSHEDNPIFWLRGMVIHAETGAILTASLMKGKYVYFHTSSRDKNKIYLNQQVIFDWFDRYIELFNIPADAVLILRSTFESIVKSEKESTDRNRKKLDKMEIEYEGKKQQIIKMRIDWELSSEEFLDEKNRLTNELITIRTSLIENDTHNDTIMESLNNALEYCTNLSHKYKIADISEKVEIIKTICLNLWLTGDKKMIVQMNSFWEAVYEANKNPLYEESREDLEQISNWLPNNYRWSKVAVELYSMCKRWSPNFWGV